jgi:pyruvate dehydrogenase E2 component (dihydrolipoyllysine-residue acetyltransferase)
MPFEFKLPDIGEGVVEGEVVRWLVKEGDVLKEDQPMVEVMTDKATVEIPTPRAGKVARLCFQVGDKVPVGATMIVLDGEGGPTAAPAPAKAAPSAAAPSAPAAIAAADVQATPAVRKLAREKGVDLSRVRGTGPGGRISAEDVERAAKGGAPAATAADAADAADVRIPFRGLRRRIAENMARSKHTAAHFTYVEEADVTELVRLREKAGGQITYLPFVVKAVVAGLQKYPMMNAVLDEQAGEIVHKKRYHIGVAAATAEGLVVPVVRDADKKTLRDIAAEIAALSERARAGKLQPADLGGSTFTITSLGLLGGVLATPILNYPEVAILGVHRIRKRPAVFEGQIAIRDLVNLSVSIDHRVVDGHEGAQFLAEVIRILESPGPLALD